MTKPSDLPTPVSKPATKNAGAPTGPAQGHTTLLDLPSELLALVVEQAILSTSLQQRVSWRKELLAYMKVHRKLVQPCTILLWKSLVVRPLDTTGKGVPSKTLLMKNGSLAEKLTIDLCEPPKPKTLPKPGGRKDKNKKKAEAAGLIPIEVTFSPSEMIENVLTSCTNVRELTFGGFGRWRDDQRKEHAESVSAFLTSTTIPSYFTALHRLTIDSMNINMANLIIAKFLTLETLSCSRIELTRGPLPDLLGNSIASLKNLSRLELDQVDGIDGAWAALDWPKTLTTLYINACPHLNPHDAPEVFRNMAPNVTHLRYIIEDEYAQEVEWDDEKRLEYESSYKLPALTHLELDSWGKADLLTWYKGCKNLEQLRYHHIDRLDWRSLVKHLADSTWPNLKRIELPHIYRYIREHIETVEKYCESHGIQLVLNIPSHVNWEQDACSDDENDEDESSFDEETRKQQLKSLSDTLEAFERGESLPGTDDTSEDSAWSESE